MPFGTPADFATGRTRTVSLSFSVSAYGQHGGNTQSGAGCTVRCDAGLLFTIGVQGIPDPSISGNLLLTKTFNGVALSSVSVLDTGQAWALDYSNSVTLQLEEWCKWDGSETFTYYERLAADPPNLPPGATSGWARKGSPITTTANPSWSPNRGILSFPMQPSYVPTFTVTLDIAPTCQPNFGLAGATASGGAGLDYPPDAAVNFSQTPTTGGHSSGTVDWTQVAGSADGSGATAAVGAGAYVTYAPGMTCQTTGKLVKYQDGDAWDGAAFKADAVASGYYQFGFPGDPPLSTWFTQAPPLPLPDPVEGGTSLSATGHQYYFERSYPGVILQGRYTFSPLMAGWDSSAAHDGSKFGAVFPLAVAPSYAIWQMKHNPVAIVDDCTAAARWTAPAIAFPIPYAAGVIAQQTTDTIRMDAGTAGNSLARLAGTATVDISSWRYLDITFRRLNAVTTPIRFRRPVTPSPGNAVLADIAEWDVLPGGLDGWTTVRLDLLKPDRILRADGMPWLNPPATRLFDSTQFPNQVDNALFGAWLWAPSLILPAGGSWEFSQFATGTASAASIRHGLYDGVVWGFGDEKTILVANSYSLGSSPTLSDLKGLVPANGWSVIPPPGGYPTAHPLYNLNAPSAWIGARTGFIDGLLDYVEKPESDGDSNGLIHYAQPAGKYLWLYPGCTAPNTDPATFEMRLGTRVYGHVWNKGLPVGSAELDLYEYYAGANPPASPDKVIGLTTGAYYTDRVNFGTTMDSPAGKTRPRAGFPFGVPPGIRTKLVEVLGKTYTPPLDTGLVGAAGWPHHASFWVDVEGGGNPWLLEDRWGRLHRASVLLGRGIVYDRSDSSVPLPDWAVHQAPVTAYDTDANPRMVVDSRGLLYLTFDRPTDPTKPDGARDVWMTRSDDDGATWNDPTQMIAGGKNPTISASPDGTLIVAALVSGVIQARVQKPGDADYGDLLTFTDGSAPIQAANDTFHLMQAYEGPARWALAMMVSGDDGPSVWVSADDIPQPGQTTMSWKKVG